MLVLKRRIGQSILIDGRILVQLMSTERGSAVLGITAPKAVPVLREEIIRPPAPKRPRYTTHPQYMGDEFAVYDNLKGQSICSVANEDLADQIAQDLNRGIVESVTPDGRWTEDAP
jgi:carbon storage regulator CsrA